MRSYIEDLNSYIAENTQTEELSMLDILYYRFCILDFVDTPEIRSLHREFADHIRQLSLQGNDRLTNTLCALCEKYQYEAFRLGLLAGFHLLRELQ